MLIEYKYLVMDFTASGHILQIEIGVKTYSKCTLKDAFSSVMILIPVGLLKDICINDEVEVWGQLKGYEFKGKIYNNLFAKSITKVNQRYILLKKKIVDGELNPRFEIIKYSPIPHSVADICEYMLGQQRGATNSSTFDSPNRYLGLDSSEVRLFHNAYSSNLAKSLDKGLIYKEHNMIILNENCNSFSKIAMETWFVLFGGGLNLDDF